MAQRIRRRTGADLLSSTALSMPSRGFDYCISINKPGVGSKFDGHANMTLCYTISPSDYKRAIWVHMRPRRFLACVGAFLVVLGLVILGITSYHLVTTGGDLKFVLGLGGGLGVLCLWFFVLLPRQLSRIYRQQKLLHEELIVEISDVHLMMKSPHGQGTLPWEVFHKWKADKQMVLVYQSDVMFHIFPRRAFPSLEDFQTFQSLLSTKLGPQKQ
jgi:hypothetical protein